MQINFCHKVYTKETHRSKNLEETYILIKNITDKIGVTRIADITKLDKVGIPVYSCIRPESKKGSISVYNGKGSTKKAAKISAIMESIERYSAEIINKKNILVNKYSILKEMNYNLINPKDLIIPQNIHYDSIISWAPGYLIDKNNMNCIDTLIPTNAIYHPLNTKYTKLFRTNTNGLASGNSIEEAIFHGLCEVIERDAWSLVEASNNAGPIIENIDDNKINRLIKLFSDAGINIILRNITSDIDITTVAAVSDDVKSKDPSLLCLGMGTHSSPKIAILRALTEVAQSRATQIHGAREDTIIADLKTKMGYERTKKINKKWFINEITCSYKNIKDQSHSDFKIEIQNIINKLVKNNLHQILFFDLTIKEINIPVVRVIVPGLECFSIDRERFGLRCKFIKYINKK